METQVAPPQTIAQEVAGLLPLSAGEAEELARAADEYADGDRVSARQAVAYFNLFATTSPTTRWLRGYLRRDLEAAPAGAHVSPEVRGITATYLATQDLLAHGWPARH